MSAPRPANVRLLGADRRRLRPRRAAGALKAHQVSRDPALRVAIVPTTLAWGALAQAMLPSMVPLVMLAARKTITPRKPESTGQAAGSPATG